MSNTWRGNYSVSERVCEFTALAQRNLTAGSLFRLGEVERQKEGRQGELVQWPQAHMMKNHVSCIERTQTSPGSQNQRYKQGKYSS